jgi:CrcB protein
MILASQFKSFLQPIALMTALPLTLIGVVLVLFLDRQPPRLLTHSFLGTGILGAFTTFSTFTVESAELLRQSKPLTALAYVIVSVVGGVLVALASMHLTRRIVGLEVAS